MQLRRRRLLMLQDKHQFVTSLMRIPWLILKSINQQLNPIKTLMYSISMIKCSCKRSNDWQQLRRKIGIKRRDRKMVQFQATAAAAIRILYTWISPQKDQVAVVVAVAAAATQWKHQVRHLLLLTFRYRAQTNHPVCNPQTKNEKSNDNARKSSRNNSWLIKICNRK